MPAPDYTAHTRRVFDEIWSKGELDAVDELFTPDCVGQDPLHPSVHGASGFKQYITEIRTAFPDFHITLDEICASGNTVVTRYTATGTNRGPLPGVGFPPTGKVSTTTGLILAHFDTSGKIKDWFATWDTLGQMVQLGVVAAPTQTIPPPVPPSQPTLQG